jgi:hypothetical protein
VDVGLHQVAERFVDAAMPLQQRLACEGAGHDLDTKMAPARGGAGVPRMLVAFIVDHEMLRRKRLLERRADPVDPRHAFSCGR